MKTPSLAKAIIQGTTWLSSSGLRELTRRDKKWVLPLAAVGTLVGAVVFQVFLINMYAGLYAAGAAAGHPELLPFYGILAGWIFIVVTAIPLGLSVLYYSNDLRLLLVLPLRPVRIFSAKAALLYLYCLPVNLFFLVPALWIYIRHTGFSAALIGPALLHLLVSPAFPLAVATLLVLVLMKTVNLSRYRIALEVAGMAIGVVLVIGLQAVLSRTTLTSFRGGTFQTLGQFPDIYSPLSRALPPVAWAARGFVPGTGPVPSLLSLALTVLTACLAMLLAPVNFLADLTERRERRGERAGALRIDARAAARRGSILRSLVRREWSIIASNSTFIFEAVGELLVLPLLLTVYGIMLPKDMIGQALSFITGSPAIGLIIMGVLVLMTNLNTVSATSLSREGKLLAISLSMPVSGRRQIGAKLAFHMMLFFPAYLVDLAITYVLFRFPLSSLLYMIPGGLALQVFGFMTGIFLDLRKPLVKWAHPQQAMKSNINAGAGIGMSFGFTAVFAAPAAALLMKGVSPMLIGCGVGVAAIALDLLLLPRLFAFADRQYSGGLELGG